jgi:hypothetical protein
MAVSGTDIAVSGAVESPKITEYIGRQKSIKIKLVTVKIKSYLQI